MFMGPLDADKAWDVNALVGEYRFLSRIQSLFERDKQNIQSSQGVEKKLHWLIQKATADIPELKFNTSIAAMMEFVNVWQSETLGREDLGRLCRVLAPFAPFLAEELWSRLQATDNRQQGSVHLQEWPQADLSLLEEEEVEIVVQVNGKVRTKFVCPKDATREELEKSALSLLDLSPKKVIVIPGKLVNLVV
jgi:leucyl-tRNA synthetase